MFWNVRYDKIILKFLKEKPIKSIRIKTHLDISIMYPWGTKYFRTFFLNNHFNLGLLKTR